MHYTKFFKVTLKLSALGLVLLLISCGDDISTSVETNDGLYNGRLIGTLHGIVKTHDTNEPMEGVEVLYVNEGMNHRLFTDSNGYYRCDQLHESSYTITFLSPDSTYADMFEIVEITLDSAMIRPSTKDYHVVISRNIDMFSKDAGLQGFIYAKKDFEQTVPARGAEVRVTDFAGILNADYSTITLSNGYFSFINLPAVPSVTLTILPWNNDGVQYSHHSMEVGTIAGGTVDVENVFLAPAQSDVIVLTNNFANGNFPVDENIEVGFSRALLEDSWSVQLSRNETEIPVISSLDRTARMLTIDPTVILRTGTIYSLHIRGRDVNFGQFEYGPIALVTEFGIALESTNLLQADGVIRNNVGLDEIITFTFTREIDAENFNNQVIIQRDDVDVLSNWEISEDGMTLEVRPEGSFRIGTEYALSYSIFSTIPYDMTSTLGDPFIFQTSARSDPPAQVAGLALDDNFAKPDWNTTTIHLRWEAIIDADHYDIYGSDDYSVIDNIYLGRVVSDRLFGAQTGAIQLPPEFDWIEGDAIQTPFTRNIQVTLQVRAISEFGTGAFSAELTIRDDLPPDYQIRQNVSAINVGNNAEIAVAFRLINQVEYCDSQSEPRWGFVENGGDSTFVLSPLDGSWEWDENYRNGTLNVLVPADSDGSGDRLWMIGLRDASGNVQSDTTWLDTI